MPDHFPARDRVAHKVPLACRIAPLAFGIPMPGLNKQFGVLAITDRAPSRFKNLFDLVRPEENIRSVAWNTIESCTQSLNRAERVRHVAWSGIDFYRLRRSTNGERHNENC